MEHVIEQYNYLLHLSEIAVKTYLIMNDSRQKKTEQLK